MLHHAGRAEFIALALGVSLAGLLAGLPSHDGTRFWLQIFVLGVFFQQTIQQAGLQVMGERCCPCCPCWAAPAAPPSGAPDLLPCGPNPAGLFLAIIGLTLFLDGLRVTVMVRGS